MAYQKLSSNQHPLVPSYAGGRSNAAVAARCPPVLGAGGSMHAAPTTTTTTTTTHSNTDYNGLQPQDPARPRNLWRSRDNSEVFTYFTGRSDDIISRDESREGSSSLSAISCIDEWVLFSPNPSDYIQSSTLRQSSAEGLDEEEDDDEEEDEDDENEGDDEDNKKDYLLNQNLPFTTEYFSLKPSSQIKSSLMKNSVSDTETISDSLNKPQQLKEDDNFSDLDGFLDSKMKNYRFGKYSLPSHNGLGSFMDTENNSKGKGKLLKGKSDALDSFGKSQEYATGQFLLNSPSITERIESWYIDHSEYIFQSDRLDKPNHNEMQKGLHGLKSRLQSDMDEFLAQSITSSVWGEDEGEEEREDDNDEGTEPKNYCNQYLSRTYFEAGVEKELESSLSNDGDTSPSIPESTTPSSRWEKITSLIVHDIIGIDDTVLNLIMGEAYIDTDGRPVSASSKSSTKPVTSTESTTKLKRTQSTPRHRQSLSDLHKRILRSYDYYAMHRTTLPSPEEASNSHANNWARDLAHLLALLKRKLLSRTTTNDTRNINSTEARSPSSVLAKSYAPDQYPRFFMDSFALSQRYSESPLTTPLTPWADKMGSISGKSRSDKTGTHWDISRTSSIVSFT